MLVLQRRSTATLWLGLMMAFAIALPLLRPMAVSAQAENEPAATEPTEAAAAAPAAGEAAATEGEPEQVSQLWWLIHTSGWIGLVLLIISIYFVALISQLFMELREQVVSPPELLSEWDSHLSKRDYNSIYKSAKESTSELGQLVAAGMASLSSGINEARDAVDRLGEAITVEMEKKISMLAVIGSLGPMIGLLGTLKGMIASFSVIATSGTQLKASEVAGGISEALLLTFEGVALSVPAIYFYAVFKNRVSTLSVQSITRADEFIRRVYSTAQGKGAAAPAAAGGQS